jgi:hypothetical protein
MWQYSRWWHLTKRAAVVVGVLAVIYALMPYKPWSVAGNSPKPIEVASGCTPEFPVKLVLSGTWAATLLRECVDPRRTRVEVTNLSTADMVIIQVVRGQVLYWDPQTVSPAELVEYQAFAQQLQQNANTGPGSFHLILPGRSVVMLSAKRNAGFFVRYFRSTPRTDSIVIALRLEDWVLTRIDPTANVESAVSGCASGLGRVFALDLSPAQKKIAVSQVASASLPCRQVEKYLRDAPSTDRAVLSERLKAKLPLPSSSEPPLLKVSMEVGGTAEGGAAETADLVPAEIEADAETLAVDAILDH